MKPYHVDSYSRIFLGDSLQILPSMKDAIFHSCVTDPPYEIGLLGRQWDSSGIAYNVDLWREVYRTLKPGAHLAAFGSPRAFHRMAVAIEDAGFELRDTIMWIHGQGMPKGQNVSKMLDKVNGAIREPKRFKARSDSSDPFSPTAEQKHPAWIEAHNKGYYETAGDEPVTEEAKQWDGWNTTLAPAYEPIVLARKPLIGTMADNIRAHGTGPINVDSARIARYDRVRSNGPAQERGEAKTVWEDHFGYKMKNVSAPHELGRYPTNTIFDEEAILELDRQARLRDPLLKSQASRFYFTSKASVREREGGLQYEATKPGKQNNHLTIKPLDLMQWLVRLITPPDGLVLDPFLGSGTTRLACRAEHMRSVGIELEEESARTAAGRG